MINWIKKDIKVLNEKEKESKMVKINILENKFIDEKEEIIINLVEKIQVFVDKCPFERENGDIIKENANANEETYIEISADETFSCDKCDFRSSNGFSQNPKPIVRKTTVWVLVNKCGTIIHISPCT